VTVRLGALGWAMGTVQADAEVFGWANTATPLVHR
jgi:hypothetical protein